MIYLGRSIDPVLLWGRYVEFGGKEPSEPYPTFLDKTVCPNPNHDTYKKHFQVNTKKPLVHCFANCGISGTYEHAIALIEGVTEREARRLILRGSRKALGREIGSLAREGTRKVATEDDPVARDERLLRGGAFTFIPKEARAYLDNRGIDASARGKWKIGWDEEEDRLVIPAFDEGGRFRFLIRRRIDGIERGKYLYTEGAIKTSLLFGACFADAHELESFGLVLCEGSLDAIRLHQNGVATAVAILGTGISPKQARIIDKLRPRRVYLMFDKDPAGVANIESALWRIRKVPMYVCKYPKGKDDPANLTREEVRRSIRNARTIHQFLQQTRSSNLLRRRVSIG
jgi:hypothetical protein